MGELFAGRFELIDPIASGGMGTVWRVHDRTDGQVKAAKMLRQSDAGMLLRFVREQSLRIDHTHIVAPQSWAAVDDRMLFTMPLVSGGSVASLIKRYGALSPWWIGRLVDQTAQALEAVHSAGVVHRDVKPGNLLLEATGRGEPVLRLTDFGIAVPTDEARLTGTNMVIGTLGYMPPEQLEGADPHPSADIYALGIVAIEMLTGQRPERSVAPIDPGRLRTGDPARDAVADLVAAATSYSPTARPTATQLRHHPALRFLLGLPADPGDPIVLTDVFPPLPRGTGEHTAPYPPPTGAAPRTAVLPPPPPGTAIETQHQPLPAVATSAGPSKVPAVLLILLGLVGLVISGWLLLAG